MRVELEIAMEENTGYLGTNLRSYRKIVVFLNILVLKIYNVIKIDFL